MWKKLLILCLLSSYVSNANDLDLNDHVGSVLVLTPGKTATNVERTAIIFYLDAINKNMLTIYPLVRLEKLSKLSQSLLGATQINFNTLSGALARPLHAPELLRIHKEMYAEVGKYVFAGDKESKALTHLNKMKEKFRAEGEHQDQAHDADETASLRTVPSLDQLADIRNTHTGLKVPHAEDFLNIRMPLLTTRAQTYTPIKISFSQPTEYIIKEGTVQEAAKALADAVNLLSDSRPCTPVKEGSSKKSANGEEEDEESDDAEEGEEEEAMEGCESQASATTDGEGETVPLSQPAVPREIVRQFMFEALVLYGANNNSVQKYVENRLFQLGYQAKPEQEHLANQHAQQGLFRAHQGSLRSVSSAAGDGFSLDGDTKASSGWWPFGSCWSCTE